MEKWIHTFKPQKSRSTHLVWVVAPQAVAEGSREGGPGQVGRHEGNHLGWRRKQKPALRWARSRGRAYGTYSKCSQIIETKEVRGCSW